jgi:hypothetical protein
MLILVFVSDDTDIPAVSAQCHLRHHLTSQCRLQPRPMVLTKHKDDTHCCETMHDDDTGVERSSFVLQRATEVSQQPETMAPSPTTFQRIIASPFVTGSCFYAWGSSSTAGLASDITKWCMKDGWRLSKRQSPTRTSSPCCGPTRRSAASRSHAWEGLYLASPTHYTTPHRALSSHAHFLGHPHILFIPPITFTQ